MKILPILFSLFMAGQVFAQSSLPNEELTRIWDEITSTDYGTASSIRARTRCYCQSGCFYGTGDSYHFRKVVDVDCSLSLKRKKDLVAHELIAHYIQAHGINNVLVIKDNVAIKCFESTVR